MNPFSAIDAAATIVQQMRLRSSNRGTDREQILAKCANIVYHRGGAQPFRGTVILCDGEYIVIGSQKIRLTENDKIELMQKVLEIG